MPDRAHGTRVLVTDGSFKHTLGIVRALADAGHEVHLLARSADDPAVHSRAVQARYAAPSSGEGLDDRMLTVAARLVPVSVLPVGSSSMAAAHRLRGRWPQGVNIAMPPAEAFETANHKDRTAAFARSVGVETPQWRAVSSTAEAAAALREYGAPMVLKSSREEGVKALRYVRAASEIGAAFAEVWSASTGGVLAQEYVRGDGYGFSALYWEGRRVRTLMHRRIREWPPTGGASTAAESLVDCPALERAGAALLDGLGWHGVAMVEFKGDPLGRLALLEINAKFWGSHDLALAAGVNFPCDLVTLLEGRPLPAAPPPRHVRFTWPLGGDLWHGLFRPASLPSVLWDAVSPGVAHNVRIGDPLPTVYETMQWLRSAPGAWRDADKLK